MGDKTVFSLPELNKMMKEIGCSESDIEQMWDCETGILVFGHPIIDMYKLSDWISKREDEPKDESLCEWLKRNSKFPIEKWEYCLGVC